MFGYEQYYEVEKEPREHKVRELLPDWNKFLDLWWKFLLSNFSTIAELGSGGLRGRIDCEVDQRPILTCLRLVLQATLDLQVSLPKEEELLTTGYKESIRGDWLGSCTCPLLLFLEVKCPTAAAFVCLFIYFLPHLAHRTFRHHRRHCARSIRFFSISLDWMLSRFWQKSPKGHFTLLIICLDALLWSIFIDVLASDVVGVVITARTIAVREGRAVATCGGRTVSASGWASSKSGDKSGGWRGLKPTTTRSRCRHHHSSNNGFTTRKIRIISMLKVQFQEKIEFYLKLCKHLCRKKYILYGFTPELWQ